MCASCPVYATITGVQSPPVPRFDAIGEYGDRLGDAGFWAPYARDALSRHGFDDRRLESGFVGTYPTFLAGDVVVKLFGYFPSWQSDHATELAIQRILLAHEEVPAPALLADGALYGAGEPWPYLITRRISGTALRDLRLEPTVARQVAYDLGTVMRDVHEIPVPAGFDRDWLAEHRANAVARHREWGLLPARLIVQLDAYLRTHLPPGERKLVHGDLTADHVFVDAGRLAGVIDWGDAQYTDPHYDLPAVYLDAFRGDPALLRAFLDGYRWPVDAGFPHRLLSAILLHQFADGELETIGKLLPLDEITCLEELAVRLYPPISG